MRKIGYKGCFVFVISILLIADLAILLNIPFLRQIFGFLFLTILPGLLILQILKLSKIEFTEKIVLLVGLSISFLMFFGLIINYLSLSVGYKTPLAMIPLLILFNLAFIVLAVIGYKANKEQIFSLSNINLSASEKAFLIVPILFPALSIFGMHVMNATANNLILMFLLFLIPIYVAFVCFFNQKFSKRMYPVVIFLISISLLLLLSLRSNHLMGIDTHQEYYLFQTALDNLHWRVFVARNALDACLCISLLPTIYHSILNTPSEFLFKILYSLIYSVSPLAIYVISKKYVGEGYAFLASCFFMFQYNFLWTTGYSRTNTAILFFALAMMTLFSDKINSLKKRILFIVFMASCMVSHYSTTYVFFFILLGTFIGIEILSKKYTFKKVVSSTIVILFFAFIFLWYSQVTETAFTAGVGFIENTISNLNRFFVEESRGESMQALYGTFAKRGIPYLIEWIFTWLTFALIGIGVITMIRRYKEMSFPEQEFKKPEFLKNKFGVTYFVIALACSGMLVVMFMLPFVSRGYGIVRLFALGITVLSVFFVIGGIILSKNLSFIKKALSKKPILKKKTFTKRSYYPKNNGENGSEVWAYLIILAVLIPYFLCVTGVMYNMVGVPRAITLNSEGDEYDIHYVHDQESYCAKWLKISTDEKAHIYADARGPMRLLSQGGIHASFAIILIKDKMAIDEGYIYGSYIYLRYYNVINGKLAGREGHSYNMTEYSDIFGEMSKVYANGGSEVWK